MSVYVGEIGGVYIRKITAPSYHLKYKSFVLLQLPSSIHQICQAYVTVSFSSQTSSQTDGPTWKHIITCVVNTSWNLTRVLSNRHRRWFFELLTSISFVDKYFHCTRPTCSPPDDIFFVLHFSRRYWPKIFNILEIFLLFTVLRYPMIQEKMK